MAPLWILHADHRALAVEAAKKSLVLLRNEGALLPLKLKKGAKLAVIGPAANDTFRLCVSLYIILIVIGIVVCSVSACDAGVGPHACAVICTLAHTHAHAPRDTIRPGSTWSGCRSVLTSWRVCCFWFLFGVCVVVFFWFFFGGGSRFSNRL